MYEVKQIANTDAKHINVSKASTTIMRKAQRQTPSKSTYQKASTIVRTQVFTSSIDCDELSNPA